MDGVDAWQHAQMADRVSAQRLPCEGEGGRKGGGRGREGVGRQPPCRAPVTATWSTAAVMVAQPARGEREKERNRRLKMEMGRGSYTEDGGRGGGSPPRRGTGIGRGWRRRCPTRFWRGREKEREGGEGKRRGERGEGEIFLPEHCRYLRSDCGALITKSNG